MGIKEYYFEIAPLKQTASESRLSRELHSVYGKKFKSLKIHEVYRLYGNMSPEEEEKAARELFFNPVVENLIRKDELPPRRILLTVKYKKGVLDTEARAVIQALEIIGIKGVESAVHEKKYIFEADISPGSIKSFAKRHLYNKVIEYAEIPGAEDSSRQRSCGSLSEDEKCPPQMPSSLSDEEKKEINKYFNKLSRRPSVAELEIIAQTWSEHCKHKTMTSSVSYVEEENGKKEKFFMNNLLKETVFKATDQLEKKYCLSVFEDNAGVISLDDNTAVAMKAETHNHPSALEPYGGASTGLGGVIRDVLGCGKGARPIMNFDVFCLGPSDMPRKDIPGDILHPKRIFEGVVKGVADYGNRMGIPTSAGALLFDQGYIYNPLVYCGTVG
ncbi:MAG: phosphoribosylformylglycinamidine synthase subunit PurS, partial [Elusimicrobiota bacterium]